MTTFETHDQENNSESQQHLNANRKKFSKQCGIVYQLLLDGVELTSRNAMINYGIGDVHRRISELKHLHNIEVLDKWEHDADGRTKYKVWWILKKIDKPPTKTSTVDWWNRYIKGEFDQPPPLVQKSLF